MTLGLEWTGDYGPVQKNFDLIDAWLARGPASARAYKAAVQSVPDNANTACTFDSERWDNAGIHSTSSNTSRLTAPTTGLYSVGAMVAFATNGTGVRYAFIQESAGSLRVQQEGRSNTGGANGVEMSLSTVWRLAAGEYVELFAYQNSGGALDVTAEFWMTRIGAYA